MSSNSDRERVAAIILALLSERAPEASICPSDAARAATEPGESWRALMPIVRDTAAQLARSGALRITRGNQTLDPYNPLGGPIRLRRGALWE